MKYERETNCGIADIEITQNEIKIEMRKFGDCVAYKFISKMMTLDLLKNLCYTDFPEGLAKKFKQYECSKGPNPSCIQAVGECIETFLSESQT